VRTKRFTLSDAMILVAATAVGLAMARAYDPMFSGAPHAKFVKLAWGAPAGVVSAWGLAVIVLRLRRPRPRVRRLLRQPGMVACCALVFALGIGAVWPMAHRVIRNRPVLHGLFDQLFNTIWNSAAYFVPWSIAAAWVTLTLSNRWRPVPDWVDRLGRVVGLYWCLYPVLEAVAPAIVRILPFLE
jgi:hypothetical protein